MSEEPSLCVLDFWLCAYFMVFIVGKYLLVAIAEVKFLHLTSWMADINWHLWFTLFLLMPHNYLYWIWKSAFLFLTYFIFYVFPPELFCHYQNACRCIIFVADFNIVLMYYQLLLYQNLLHSSILWSYHVIVYDWYYDKFHLDKLERKMIPR